MFLVYKKVFLCKSEIENYAPFYLNSTIEISVET